MSSGPMTGGGVCGGGGGGGGGGFGGDFAAEVPVAVSTACPEPEEQVLGVKRREERPIRSIAVC